MWVFGGKMGVWVGETLEKCKKHVRKPLKKFENLQKSKQNDRKLSKT